MKVLASVGNVKIMYVIATVIAQIGTVEIIRRYWSVWMILNHKMLLAHIHHLFLLKAVIIISFLLIIWATNLHVYWFTIIHISSKKIRAWDSTFETIKDRYCWDDTKTTNKRETIHRAQLKV